MIIGHGGNKQALADELGCSVQEIIDMSSNLNPLGPPDFVNRVIQENLSAIKSLPEPDALSMRKGFADYHGLHSDSVVAGNGTTWFIYTLPVALGVKRVLITGPTYSDYQDACTMNAIPFRQYYSSADQAFVPDMDYLAAKAGNADLVFICNPNNPTGVLMDKEKLTYLLDKHPATLFVVDESYLPFVEGAARISLVGETRFDNLIVLSSMSKIFRIPGLRTGFLSAPGTITQKIMAHYQPWSVNALAQEVIRYIFDHPEAIEPFYEKTRIYTRDEKKYFTDQLQDMGGLELYDSAAYFILARLTNGMDSAAFCSQVGKAKLLIRDCANFKGLSNQFVRFSLKERSINLKLAGQIKAVLNR